MKLDRIDEGVLKRMSATLRYSGWELCGRTGLFIDEFVSVGDVMSLRAVVSKEHVSDQVGPKP